jgi:hypothetical protein
MRTVYYLNFDIILGVTGMVLAANVFSLCLWHDIRAKRFTLGTVSFPSDDWIIFVFKNSVL